MHELVSASREGRLQEFFGCATTSNIQPVSRIVYEDENIILDAAGTNFPFSNYLNNKMTSIMTGSPDHEWITPLE